MYIFKKEKKFFKNGNDDNEIKIFYNMIINY